MYVYIGYVWTKHFHSEFFYSISCRLKYKIFLKKTEKNKYNLYNKYNNTETRKVIVKLWAEQRLS